MPKRIGFVSQWYAPENVWVPSAVVQGLRDLGNEVRVITGVPHYPSGVVTKGYHALDWRQEFVNDVKVYRVPEYPYRGRGLLGRFAGYASFALTASWAVLRHFRDCDAVLVYGSPATAALPAMILRWAHGVPYVLQVQDIWPDSVTGSGFLPPTAWRRAISSLLGVYVTRAYASAEALVAITPMAQDLLGKRRGASNKVHLVYNWAPDPQRKRRLPLVKSLRDRIGASDGDRVFLYAGAMGPAQNLRALVKGFAEAGIDAHLVLMGAGVERKPLEQMAVTFDRVHVLPATPLEEASSLTVEADVAIVSLSDSPLHQATFPSKIQFLCGLGKPVLAAAPGDPGRYVEQNGFGFSADPSDVGAIAATFGRFYAMSDDEIRESGLNARHCYERDFDPAVGSRKVDSLLSVVARAKRPERRTGSMTTMSR